MEYLSISRPLNLLKRAIVKNLFLLFSYPINYLINRYYYKGKGLSGTPFRLVATPTYPFAKLLIFTTNTGVQMLKVKIL